MKILHTIPSMLASCGGPTTCTYDLLNGLNNSGQEAYLLTSAGRSKGEYVIGENSKWMKIVPNDLKTPLSYSINIRHFLADSVKDFDIYHVNTLWLYTSHIASVTAQRASKPYVLSPHGMLYPTALKVSAWKKRLMLKIWFHKDIFKASCLHATCKQEMKYIRDFGYKGPIAVIPNPVVLPIGVGLKKSAPSKKVLGYLGRLHPIKKIDALLQGAALVIEQGCDIPFSIELMGIGEANYELFLRNEVKRLGLQDVVKFIGFVNGRDKYIRLANIWTLFVPSTQENFGMIVPEALICGTPVYASHGTPWKELITEGCGWWCDNKPETIASVIIDALNKSEEEILTMGFRGRKLIEEKYEQNKVASMMAELYQWIGGKQKEKPKFVY